MTDDDTPPFIGELRLMSFAFAPDTWAQCNGQLLPINDNTALFRLLGTRYGGDGKTTFALPDLRERTPIHFDDAFPLGKATGEDAHQLTAAEARHLHTAVGSLEGANQPTPSVLGTANNMYAPADDNLTSIHPQTIDFTGGSEAHENRHPYLTLNWCIALSGDYPQKD
jgi:microcystin-dependent protein